MTPVQAPLPLGHSRDMLRAQLTQRLAMHHRGRDSGINASALSMWLGVSERLLRELITAARADGIAIVGTPETGYYVAQTGEELEECCQFLRARAMHSLQIEARLRKVALPELLGQLKVGT